ncbi:MAG: MoxR family ATPase [Thermofilaceae archaeon]|nr:MoxR family ATPase [Thermofilaceae archaeon]MCX8179918.1 MoxR family ATPase [Thermofilaceae archaeon]MDW8004391.1 MoxR family ATPase [Thermofilaceae archaeon]
MRVEDVGKVCGEVLEEVGKVIVGKKDVIEKLLVALLARGHVLIEDYPGLAKTLMAKTLAQALGLSFKRVQFTPDLLPADITGTYVYNQKTGEFELRRGPVFTHILLADEINRAPPKTQSALLEAMQERQVTLDGVTYRLEEPFLVIATQNPIEFEGVYPLPEAQLDRFSMRLRVGYPSEREEVEILKRRLSRRSDEARVEVVAGQRDVLEMQKAVEDVHVDESVLEYIVSVARVTRQHSRVEVGVSPRGAETLMKLARARAALYGRDYVIPDDVKELAVEALAHRLVLRAEQWVKGADPESVVRDVIASVPVPKTV